MSRQSTKIARVCKTCQKQFELPLWAISRGRGVFCSKPCYRASRVIPLEVKFYWHLSEPNENGCVLWIGTKDSHGYGLLAVPKNPGKTIFAHRLAYRFAYGEFDENLFVCHHCDTPLCCNPAHLFLGQSIDNVADMHKKGRVYRLKKSPGKTLTKEDVLEIRERYAKGEPQSVIAKDHGISRGYVSSLVVRKAWKHIP